MSEDLEEITYYRSPLSHKYENNIYKVNKNNIQILEIIKFFLNFETPSTNAYIYSYGLLVVVFHFFGNSSQFSQ